MKEGENNSVLAVPEVLPPGLFPLLETEDTDKYLTTNFNHANHTLEDLGDYGAFMVTLALWSASETGRIDLAPTARDFREMYKAGYGPSYYRLQQYGGVAAVRRQLGYYPEDFRPEQSELLDRFRWMAQHALQPPLDIAPETPKKLNQVIQWGADRSLLPSRTITLDVLGSARGEVQRLFGLETRVLRNQYTHNDVYRFGAHVIRENNGPLTRDKMNKKYRNYFRAHPGNVIVAFFGSITKFWLKFDRLPFAHGLTDQELVTVGIRHAIKSGTPYMSASVLRTLSKKQEFTQAPIDRGLKAYRAAVEAGYDIYLDARNRYTQSGITPEVFQAACRKFEPTPAFEYGLWENFNTLHRLSSKTRPAIFALKAIQHGFDLEHDDIFARQHRALERALHDLDITGNDRKFVYDLIPRIDANEMLALRLPLAS
ncbi:MAG TPA: hypothetical protein VK694_04340 [Verrucomicrobiae bacterium]|nr:hypothetical protein [Verrucomicrobiae bacterium]